MRIASVAPLCVFERDGIFCRKHISGNGFYPLRIACFASERKRIDYTEPVRNPHSAESKRRRAGGAKRKRKLKHNVCPAHNGRPCPLVFVNDSRRSALGKAAAHYGYDAIASALQLRYLIFVTSVKRVVFAYDGANLHKKLLFRGKWGCNRRIIAV